MPSSAMRFKEMFISFKTSGLLSDEEERIATTTSADLNATSISLAQASPKDRFLESIQTSQPCLAR